MIYGLNFNGSRIPDGYLRKFASMRKIDGKKLFLVGVCENANEKQAMILVADNGHRTLECVERHGLYAIYAG